MPTDAPTRDGVVLGRRFARAVEWACALHAEQVKKGTDVPYAAHVLSVAALVLEDGGNQTQAIAALLHDALEDTTTTRKEVRKRFGRKVARIVAECTDVPTGKQAKGSKRRRDGASWRERKTRTLDHLRDPDTSTAVLRVTAADSLANARTTLADLRRYGPETWERFHVGAVDQLWYYRSLSIVLSARLPGLLSDELRVTVRELEELAGWWFDVGDPQLGGA
jgi:(p)ppGpp synthase/HD superfamily hydrolase